MEKLNRRKLITQASVGAGAVGVLAIAAACDTAGASSNVTIGPNDDPPAFFVTDSAKGTIKIMRGDQEVVINDTDLTQKLLAQIK